MTTYDELIPRIIAWHEKRFPLAESVHVGLKLFSEGGELADALVEDSGVNNGAGERSSVKLEAPDVFICLHVILGRWYKDIDLLKEVDEKITRLETPGAHKSSSL